MAGRQGDEKRKSTLARRAGKNSRKMGFTFSPKISRPVVKASLDRAKCGILLSAFVTTPTLIKRFLSEIPTCCYICDLEFSCKMEENFVKADSNNLPKVDACMVGLFFASNADFYGAELRNIKTVRSARESYGDDAIGYVQLLRNGDLCTVKCKITPEHKVRSRAYNVTLIIDEAKGEVMSCQCHDCAASAGGCKHAVAFLMWVHRRSEEPSCTSIECYWKKSTLSKVGTTVKNITVQDLSKTEVPRRPSSPALLTEFLLEANKRKIKNCELLRYQQDFQHVDVTKYSMHCLEYRGNVNEHIESMQEQYSATIIKTIEEATRDQSKSHLWYELRYGRITASKAHETSVCKTADGSLVGAIMGAKTPDTAAMKRGRILETSVRKIVGNKLGQKFTSCGLFVSQEYPMIAASPDGICKDAIIEIKCPTSDKAAKNYIKNGVISDKCKAQVQIQMFTANRKICYFCVAHADFENSKNVEIMLVNYDPEYVCELVDKMILFWKANIYPILSRNSVKDL